MFVFSQFCGLGFLSIDTLRFNDTLLVDHPSFFAFGTHKQFCDLE